MQHEVLANLVQIRVQHFRLVTITDQSDVPIHLKSKKRKVGNSLETQSQTTFLPYSL